MGLHFGRLVATALIAVAGLMVGAPNLRAANLDEACGGPDKITCNSALFCRKEVGQCGIEEAKGTCEKAPAFCIRIHRPVCGCNGKTYPNECEARHVKVAIDYTGPCKKAPGAAESKPEKPSATKKKKSSK
jgi:Kazal-type serine protease inhibitor-like protein